MLFLQGADNDHACCEYEPTYEDAPSLINFNAVLTKILALISEKSWFRHCDYISYNENKIECF